VIPGLPQVGATELIILLSIILLLFGAKRIPELARSLGRGKREFHKGASEDADALTNYLKRDRRCWRRYHSKMQATLISPR
jgi:sec-independent protein translocase protein TatA